MIFLYVQVIHLKMHLIVYYQNSNIIEYILTLKYPHLIKLHPLAYEYKETSTHPFLQLTNLEKEHVEKLYQTENILLNKQINILKLIEHAK